MSKQMTQKIIDAAREIPGFVRVEEESEYSVSFIFDSVPSYAEQFALQKIINPKADDTKNIKCYIFHNDGCVHLSVRT